jgi:hypothetical protein
METLDFGFRISEVGWGRGAALNEKPGALTVAARKKRAAFRDALPASHNLQSAIRDEKAVVHYKRAIARMQIPRAFPSCGSLGER